jgi:amino acid adenylation domain-containing protein
MLLHQLLEATARRTPDKVALVTGGRRFTYTDLDALSSRLAARLQGVGVERGDRVAIFADNGIETVVAIYGALKAGAVFMPVNPLTKGDKLAHLLGDSGSACLITTQALRSVWGAALAQKAIVRSCIVAGLPAADADTRLSSYEDAVTSTRSVQAPPTIDQDLACVIYTSGSSGEPKGVMLTHLNMVSAARSVNGYLGMTDDDIIMCALPLAFDYGLYQILMAFMVGATVVLEHSFAFPVKVLETMAKEGVTVFPVVPTMLSIVIGLRNLRQFDLRRLRMITNTAAALSERHVADVRALFPQASLFSMYGLTECKRVTYLPPEQLAIRPTSVGRGMPNEEVWLVDEQGKRLPNGCTGELVIRGSNVMRGYWRRPEQTAARLRPGPFPGEVVLYSGDIFRTDEEGYLYFVARKDDIVKSRGEKVSPKEVENVLYGLEGVQDAAVIGVPDPVLGAAIKAVLVLRSGYSYRERDVIKHCLEKLESFMVPKYVEFVDELPTTKTGKIDKSALK